MIKDGSDHQYKLASIENGLPGLGEVVAGAVSSPVEAGAPTGGGGGAGGGQAGVQNLWVKCTLFCTTLC